MHTTAVLVEATFYSEFVEWLAFPPDGQNFHLQGLELFCTLLHLGPSGDSHFLAT